MLSIIQLECDPPRRTFDIMYAIHSRHVNSVVWQSVTRVTLAMLTAWSGRVRTPIRDGK